MKTLTALALCVLGLVTGCAYSKPVVMAPVAAEADPWAGFNNGYEKAVAKAEAKPEAKPEATKAEATAKSDEDVAPEPAKKVSKKAKKGGGKKAPIATVSGKKPRKRTKRAS